MDNDYKNPWENENLKNPWGQQQKVEDNKSFFKGMVIGVTISLTLFIAILVGNILINKEYIETDDNKQMLENAGLDSEGSTGEDETGATPELNLDKVFNKAEYIKKLIDEYYYYEGDMANIEQGLYAGMVAALGDPYSVYYDKESFKAMMESTVGTYCGIGVVVQQNMETMTISVVNPYKDCPGYEAGMRPGDIILGTDEVDFTGMDINEAVSYIRGEENTTVKIKVLRGEEELTFDVTRKVIDIQTVSYELLEGNIAYIKIESFDEVTYGQFKEAMTNAKKDNCVGYIFDVRDNGGGLYDTVVDMLDDLLPKGKIVYTEDKYGHKETEFSDEDCIDKPIAVLTNGNSASASEIFAGAIQDYGTGKIIGTQTFGKGIVQSIIPLGDGTAVKLTVSSYFTPNGRNIHGEGIAPDQVVELPEEKEAYENGYIKRECDTQLNEAVKYILGE
jgi:carboxyl-terminal processing protease